MNIKKVGICALLFLVAVCSYPAYAGVTLIDGSVLGNYLSALTWLGSMDGGGYDLTNVDNMNATKFNQDGNDVLDTTDNTSTYTYIDAQDVAYNSSVKAYADSQDTAFNTSMKSYADAIVAALSSVYCSLAGCTMVGSLNISSGNLYVQNTTIDSEGIKFISQIDVDGNGTIIANDWSQTGSQTGAYGYHDGAGTNLHLEHDGSGINALYDCDGAGKCVNIDSESTTNPGFIMDAQTITSTCDISLAGAIYFNETWEYGDYYRGSYWLCNGDYWEIINKKEWTTPSSDEGLLMYYPLSEIVLDLSGNSNDAKTISGTIYIENGKIGGAYNSSGAADYIELEKNQTFDGLTKLTVMGYVYAYDDQQGFWLYKDSQIFIGKHTSYKWYSRVYNTTGGYCEIKQGAGADYPVRKNTWHYVALNYDDDDDLFRLYVDGNLRYSIACDIGPLASNNNGLYLMGTGSLNWDGTVDEIRAYNRSVSVEELRAIQAETAQFNPNKGTARRKGDMLDMTANTTAVVCNLVNEGNFYYDSALKRPCFCNSTDWVNMNGSDFC